ncbi:MAG: hypothetical protein ACI87T_001625 [Planctomycetota bacterium]|jgi:hypothetical protein
MDRPLIVAPALLPGEGLVGQDLGQHAHHVAAHQLGDPVLRPPQRQHFMGEGGELRRVEMRRD